MPRMPSFKAPPAVAQAAKLSTMPYTAQSELLGRTVGNNPVTSAVSAGQAALDRAMGVKSKEDTARDEAAAAQAAAAQAAHNQMLRDLPQLQDRVGSQTLGAAGQFSASTIGQSPWHSLAQAQQGVQQQRAGDTLARQNAMLAAQARGPGMGASSGISEQAGLANMRNQALTRQNLVTQGGTQRQAIAQQGAGRGLDISQFNAGQSQQANQANVGQSIKDLSQENAFNRLKYGEQMKFKAGQESGGALDRASGGKK